MQFEIKTAHERDVLLMRSSRRSSAADWLRRYIILVALSVC